MGRSPFRRSFPLSDATSDVRWEQRKSSAEGEMFDGYKPRLNYYRLGQEVDDLRLRMRKEVGEEHFPPEVRDRLRNLASALNKVQLAEDKSTERIRVQNALVEVKGALETVERHSLPEQELLTQLQIDLVRVQNELAPNQSHGHHR